MERSDFVILNGFDRSGSSAISRTLAAHPDIELIMQPFNSGFLRKEMYRVIEKGNQLDEARKFFEDLQNNYLNSNLIHSHWHEQYSTTQQHIAGKIHVVKTTINHFAQRWMMEKYPGVEVWGIWRDPYEIFHSIIKNDFQNKWYVNAWEELKLTIKEEQVLSVYHPFLDENLSENQELALLISVRSYFFFYYLKKENLLRYAVFRTNINDAFRDFISRYDLDGYDFNEESTKDLNIIGQKYDPDKKSDLDQEIRTEIRSIMDPLTELYNEKYNIK